MAQTILITGAAGFIGSSLTDRMLGSGWRVVGVDNFCDFYDESAKRRNIAEAMEHEAFELVEADIRDAVAMRRTFQRTKPAALVHIAAMAGVRPSIEDPAYYVQVNLDGTVNVLDAAVEADVQKVLFASSSSVYGNNSKVPFAEDDPVDCQISPYAATKRACELLCHTYWHLHQLPVFCFRFFTVFGPRQRPDLAISKFLKLVAEDQPIPVFGDGSTSRDYTYIDDIVDGLTAALDRCDRYRIYNLGGNVPVTLSELIAAIGRVVGKEPRIDRQPMQPGDVQRTYADLTRSTAELGFLPKVSLEEGIRRQWHWLQSQ